MPSTQGTRHSAPDASSARDALDTVGKAVWPEDAQRGVLYPEGFVELAGKLKRPLHPPGRDIRCIVSVGMLTEGWDCRTVTHIIGLRPFQSQLLCEQVVGRGLRRTSYETGDNGLMTEEVSRILGVPFEIIPFKMPPGTPKPPARRHHIRALPDRSRFEVTFPRVEGYTAPPARRISIDWDTVPPLHLDPTRQPTSAELKAVLPDEKGRPTLHGPGGMEELTLDEWRARVREQKVVFAIAARLTSELQPATDLPSHTLFAQMQPIVARYLGEKVDAPPGTEPKDVALNPYFGQAKERIREAIRPASDDGSAAEIPRYEQHRGPGSSADVDFWTSRQEDRLREANRTHVNLVVCDTNKWEQEAAYHLDRHPAVHAFVKNVGLGFAVPYVHNGEQHDFEVDDIVRLQDEAGEPIGHLLLEPKGFDPLAEVKQEAAHRWSNAVNNEGLLRPLDLRHGQEDDRRPRAHRRGYRPPTSLEINPRRGDQWHAQ